MRHLGSWKFSPKMWNRELKDIFPCSYSYSWIGNYLSYHINSLLKRLEDLFKPKIKTKNHGKNTRFVITSRMHMAFQGPMLNCFEEIDKILLSYQAKDLIHVLPQILETLFNFDGACSEEMNFGRLTSNQAYDFQVANHFFGLQSPLISLVAKLTADPNCCTLYEFPFARLSPATRNSIQTGRIPAFYASKIKYGTSGNIPESIMLDAFDLYMFHFAYYIVNPHNWKILHMIGETSHKSEWIYFSLLHGYLKAFFPASNDLPVRVTKLHPRLHQQPPNHPLNGSSFRQSLQAGLASSPTNASFTVKAGQIPRVSRLLNLDPHLMSQLNNSQMDSMASADVSMTANTGLQGDLFSGSDAVLQIFVDFWLNQFDSSVLEQHVWLTNKMLKVEDFFLLIRLLVKHLHLFVNSSFADDPWGTSPAMCNPLTTAYISPSFSSDFIKNITPIQQKHIQQQQQQQQQVKQHRSIYTQEQREWDDFKRSIWSPWLSSKLYNFLKYHFMYGPIERPLIEIWLSFIQPWRYTSEELQLEGEKFIDNKWIPFVRKHLLFYTTFLQLVMDRFLSLDLTSPANSLLLARVTKVFSIEYLKDALEEVESSVNTTSDRLNLSSSSYTHPRELEGNDFRYMPLFSADVKNQAIKLLTSIMVTKEYLESQLVATQNEVKGRSWLQRMAAFLNASDESSFGPSMRKIADQLDVSAIQISSFFTISMSELPSTSSYINRSGHQSSPRLGRHNHNKKELNEDLPDMVVNKDGSYVLTPRGRQEILMKKKKIDVEYLGDPDLQPIRSYECGPLVRFLYKFCRDINKKFAKDIQKSTEQPGLSGMMARYIFCGQEGATPKRAPNSTRGSPQHGFTTPRARCLGGSPNQPELILSPEGVLTNRWKHPPRLSLRFLARYSSLAIILLTMLVIKIWFGLDFMSVFILFGLVIIAFFSLMMKIILSSHETNAEDPPVRRTLFKNSDDQ